MQIGEQCWFAENLRCLAKESGSSLEVFSESGEWAGTNLLPRDFTVLQRRVGIIVLQ